MAGISAGLYRPLRLGLRVVGIEPPGSARQDPVVAVDDMGIAEGQRDGKLGIHVHGEGGSGDEVVVPEVVRMRKQTNGVSSSAMPRRNAPAWPRLVPELHVAKPRVAEAREAAPDGLVQAVRRGIVDDDDLKVADGLARHRLRWPSRRRRSRCDWRRRLRRGGANGIAGRISGLGRRGGMLDLWHKSAASSLDRDGSELSDRKPLSKACRAAILLSARTAHEGENIATAASARVRTRGGTMSAQAC